LEGFVLVLHTLDEVGQFCLQHLLDVLLLDHFACERLVVIFVTIRFVGARETSPPQTFVHLYYKRPHLLIPFLHS
jgi:hypothetical protein